MRAIHRLLLLPVLLFVVALGCTGVLGDFEILKGVPADATAPDDSGGPPDQSAPTARLTIAPKGHHLGQWGISTRSTPVTLTAKNTGDAKSGILQVIKEGPTPDQFDLGPNQCAGQTLDPGAECKIDVVFAPKSLGRKDVY